MEPIRKKQFIKALAPGQLLDDVFMLSQKELKHKRDGNPFLTIELADKSGKIRGVIWDHVERLNNAARSGDYVRAQGKISEYNGGVQAVLQEMAVCLPEMLNPMDFLPATSRDTDKMFERLCKIVSDRLQNPELRRLVDAFFNDPEFVAQFKIAPGAKRMHHAYLGGLLEHTLSMCILTERLGGHYTGIDMDLLLTGAILHDIGKIRELEYRFKIDYSDEGRFLSHILIGCQMVDEKLRELPDFPRELACLLKHMIVSHHGSREFGSPEPPKTIEAVLLNLIDDIDAKVNGIREFMNKQEDGESWTGYHRLLERHFFKGTPDGD